MCETASGDWSPASAPVAGVRWVREPDVEPSLLPAAADEARPLGADGLLMADSWLAALPRRGPLPVLYVTRRPLATRRCRSVFGYADRRRRAALVSLAGIETPDPARTRRRLAAVAAHELGHLAGFGHCRQPGCAMRPARSAEELDGRSLALCPACRRRRRRRIAASLLAVCLAVSLLLDAAIERIRHRSRIFTSRAEAGAGVVLMEDHPVLRLRSLQAAAAAAEALNRIYADMDAPSLRLELEGTEARVAAGPWVIFRLRDLAEGGAPAAREWISRVDPLLQGKGPEARGCPACHVLRRGEVLEAKRTRSLPWKMR